MAIDEVGSESQIKWIRHEPMTGTHICHFLFDIPLLTKHAFSKSLYFIHFLV